MTEATINRIRQFITDRDWGQYHSPANLAKSISIEANDKARGSRKKYTEL